MYTIQGNIFINLSLLTELYYRNIAPTVITLAEAEGLVEHAESVWKRVG
jgi:histidinol dehydrogenase